ncbi:MAG TPA: hypothetical protein EYP49_03215 [Anaerolineae bacterium]|nr:hypothetical protein [Anaerolineae bacterium]
MATYTQVATILQRALGEEEGLLVLEYFESRFPPDVARQRDVSETEAALRLEIEKVRAEIEKVRADLTVQIERSQATQTRWAFLFWISQMAVLVGVLFRLLS